MQISFLFAWLPLLDKSPVLNSAIEYQPYTTDVNVDISFLVNPNATRDNVKGLQFDIIYDSNSLMVNEIVSLVDGAVFEHSFLEDRVRCIMFHLDGTIITDLELNKIINLSFTQFSNFYGKTEVKLDSVIVAGSYGEDISSDYNYNSWLIDFINLKPLYTYVYTPSSIFFSDTIRVSYQLHEEGRVESELYDSFGGKVKTLLDEYMIEGRHTFLIDAYNELDEKVDYGAYRLEFSTSYGYLDSLNIVYQKPVD